MAVSLNSVVGFNSTLQVKHQHVRRSSVGSSAAKAIQCTFQLGMFEPRRHVEDRRWALCLSNADSKMLATDTSNRGFEDAERSLSDNPPPLVDSVEGSDYSDTDVKISESPNGSVTSLDLNLETSTSPSSQSAIKKVPLTARERLRAARVLSRYTESKPSKSEMGSKVLEALKESDRGKKKSRLPEAPTNLFDDSKRGLPKQGFTFQFPGGSDLFIIAFSFVFISTVMFATTYIVWKVGAIHFNEY